MDKLKVVYFFFLMGCKANIGMVNPIHFNLILLSSRYNKENNTKNDSPLEKTMNLS